MLQICQSVWSPQSVVSMLERHCVSFLRLAAMLQHHLFEEALPILQPDVRVTWASVVSQRKSWHICRERKNAKSVICETHLSSVCTFALSGGRVGVRDPAEVPGAGIAGQRDWRSPGYRGGGRRRRSSAIPDRRALDVRAAGRPPEVLVQPVHSVRQQASFRRQGE